MLSLGDNEVFYALCEAARALYYASTRFERCCPSDHPRCSSASFLSHTARFRRRSIAQGSGKGTHKSRLEKRYDLRSLVVGDLLRTAIRDRTPLGLKVDKVIKEGGLAEDEDVAGIVENEVEKLKGHVRSL